MGNEHPLEASSRFIAPEAAWEITGWNIGSLTLINSGILESYYLMDVRYVPAIKKACGGLNGKRRKYLTTRSRISVESTFRIFNPNLYSVAPATVSIALG